ncbi:MAG: phasin family protein [Gemmatimonadota bacterium]|nr:phasin family protein [Gemmatimonadota bacterium]MDH4348359.1 phasin family protein [Gemmatimonadota bacterium]MDH5284232.1 phasin family protein [Gemmatimonadota bacterium]
MAKKNGKKAHAVPKMKESAHDIWLAGLGAFALAGEEGGKLFRELVKKGEGLEKINKARIGKIVDRAESLRGDARQAIAKVGNPLEAGMTGAMHRIGMPTRKEIADLSRRVEELTRVVAKSKAAGRTRARQPRRAAKLQSVGAA